ncbi:MAG TPA: transcriptional regulator [Candidatus Thermoplasmatota archaeon]|jgi:putative transcriptional regulator|nr:transcriptional regulator [Candidatus Thermoplasmatota archaeon]
MRADLIERTREVLRRAGFQLSEPSHPRAVSFDMVARRGASLLLVKVFTNADSLSEVLGAELRCLAGLLQASPLLVGERSSAGPLEDGVMYFRHRVALVTPATLEQALVGDQPPLVYAAPGGYYVMIDGATLRGLRAARGLSLGQIAEAAGVSRRAVAMYEEGMGALVEVAERLEQFLGEPLVRPVDVFRPPDPQAPPAFDPARVREALERQVLARMSQLGFRVVLTERAPFNAVSQDPRRDETLILTGIGELQPEMAERARALLSIAFIAEREVAIFVRDRKAREQVEGAAVISQDELAGMDERGEVLDLIRERAKPAREAQES